MGLSEKFRSLSPLKRDLLAAEALFFLILIFYSNSFTAPFMFDDSHQIVKNQYIKDLANIPGFFYNGNYSSYLQFTIYRPILFVSFTLDHFLGDGGVLPFHITNFLLHFFNSFLVFLVVRRIYAKSGGGEGHAGAAFCVSALFALHPVQTGAVTYVSGRSVLLVSFFLLLAFYLYIRGREDGSLLRLCALPLFFAALLTKEMAVCFILLAILYNWIFERKKKPDYPFYLASASALALYVFIKVKMQGSLGEPVLSYGPLAYFVSETKIVAYIYLRLAFFPFNQNADHNLRPTGADADFFVALALLMAVFAFLIKNARRSPSAAFFGLWAFVCIAPESSFFPITDMAVEYRMYLPLAGIAAALVPFVSAYMGRRPLKVYAAAAVLLFLGALTLGRNAVWGDELLFWQDAASKAPASARARSGVGNALIKMDRFDEAGLEYRKALELGPGEWEKASIHVNLGNIERSKNNLADAVREYQAAIGIKPVMLDPYINIAGICSATGRHELAIESLNKASAIRRDYYYPHFLLAYEYFSLRRTADAVREIETARRLNPNDFGVNLAVASIYAQASMKEKAKAQGEKTLAMAREEKQRRAAMELLKGL